jgi:predicted RNA-binding protein with PIN domain
MSDATGSEPSDGERSAAAFLPEAVRRRTVDIAAAAMPGLPPGKLPPTLRRFLKFSPSKRAKHAGAAIAAELASNDDFRSGLGSVLAETDAPLVRTIAEGGEVSAMADPVEAAALAFLLRPEGWRGIVDAAAAALEHTEPEPAAAEVPEEARRRLEAAEKENTRLRDALSDQRAAATELQDELRRVRRELRDAEERSEKARNDLSAERGRAKQFEGERRTERRRLESEVDSLRASLDQVRREGREADRLVTARLWLLLETLSGTASGLRRELGVEPVEERPADYVAETRCAEPEVLDADRARGLELGDPQRLDHLLSLPNAHLIVDGYNVTISAWGDTLTLEQQRNRLVQGLGTLAAQTGSEVTVVFDGADPVFGVRPAARGVRVLFSAKGQIADDVVVDLARVEPQGRPVVVVSSDREVAERSRRYGAYAVPSPALVKRLQRAGS